MVMAIFMTCISIGCVQEEDTPDVVLSVRALYCSVRFCGRRRTREPATFGSAEGTERRLPQFVCQCGFAAERLASAYKSSVCQHEKRVDEKARGVDRYPSALVIGSGSPLRTSNLQMS